MAYRLSPSRLNLFVDCNRCFYLDVVKKQRRPEKPFPSLPNGIDRCIKQHFDSFRGKDPVPGEIEGCAKEIELFPDQEFVDYARSWRTEPKWRDPKTDIVLRGGVDELLRDRNGRIIVLDFKTRGKPPEKEGVPDYYRRQLNLYNLIFEANGYRTPSYGYILYLYPDRFRQEGDFLFETELRKVNLEVEEAKKLVRDAFQVLEEGIVSEHSEECKYSNWHPVK